MMKFVTHENIEREKAQANSLRRYVAARAAGRVHPEYAKIETRDGIVVWHGCTETDARNSGGASRRLRLPGPWCPYLGRDTSIQSDHELLAFLELRVSDYAREREHDWNTLLRDVSKNRVAALRSWRVKGREILGRQRQRSASPAAAVAAAKRAIVEDAARNPADKKHPVDEKYLKRGTGVNPLKALKSAK